jgi:hypothetical protein
MSGDWRKRNSNTIDGKRYGHNYLVKHDNWGDSFILHEINSKKYFLYRGVDDPGQCRTKHVTLHWKHGYKAIHFDRFAGPFTNLKAAQVALLLIYSTESK